MERALRPARRSSSLPQLFDGPFLDLVGEPRELVRFTFSAELNPLPLAVLVEEHDPATSLFEEWSQTGRALELQ